MFELEALLLGIEPITALAVGVGAVLLAPVVDTVGNWVKEDEKLNGVGESVSQSAREATKSALIWGMDVIEGIQSTFADAQESFNDLVAEAKDEHRATRAKAQEQPTPPRAVEIVSE
ncbi:MAG: DUF5132 domain-containing protein [Synechococcales cyanobacterium M58_A2018_015]|nr:DUF5132 domain-containing protein [Synechococcales cyanobacterium M58_A2018_015]